MESPDLCTSTLSASADRRCALTDLLLYRMTVEDNAIQIGTTISL